ncbi:MAG: CRISPR-associated helicase Cas3' [Coriobacteriales bacterium]|jgi:CRISPR-associated endonuclease/helicase Cas3|nr:CRISPR-associated helicase Cas3' [Coriobacteriales bacterium]
MNKIEMLEYLKMLGRELKKRDETGEIILAGGASMALVHSARDMTKDVDALYEPTSSINGIVIKIAEEYGLAEDWLSDSAKGLIGVNAPGESFIELPGLVISTVSPNYLLSMKLLSARYGEKDYEDIAFLIDELGISSADEVYKITEKYWPVQDITPKTVYVIEEFFDDLAPRDDAPALSISAQSEHEEPDEKKNLNYIAHQADDGREQSIANHLNNTAMLAGEFAKLFGAEILAFKIGLFHDLGKYSKAFQQRIRKATMRVDHSTAGGQFLNEANPDVLGRIAAYCVLGHHGGLPNGGTEANTDDDSTLVARLKRDIPDYSAFKEDSTFSNKDMRLSAPADFRPETSEVGFSIAFLTRMLYSTLVDADWIDTETFMSNGEVKRGGFDAVEGLLNKLNTFLVDFQKKTEKTDLNVKRNELLSNCIEKAAKPRGLFTLTAPTGSGKTLSSVAFGLNHAALNKQGRIIYVVPYNTIIEQNAKVFEDIFGMDNVLQHHSGINYESNEDEPEYSKLLATENWDATLIVTSSVRFFEGLYKNKPSECRKLHNIANSVIVLDEAQMIPLPHLIPCVRALKELVTHYGCTVVLMTATQSSLDEYFLPLIPTEIVENPQHMYEFFRRVTYVKLETPLSNEELVAWVKSHEQVLCIVNARKRAQIISELLGPDAYHLSTTMVPVHRTCVLAEIREKLEKGEVCQIVSTSMIEAGVDVDFPVVYREKAGLDSIIQSGGRCNREGERRLDDSMVYIFTMKDSSQKLITQNVAAYEHAARNDDDITSLEAIQVYFKYLRSVIGSEGLDKDAVVGAFNKESGSFLFPFKDVAKKFKLINDATRSIIVPFDQNAESIIARLRNYEYSRVLFRSVQQYSVSLYEDDIKKLFDMGAIEYMNKNDEEILILSKSCYNTRYGVSLSPEGGVALFG